MKRKDALNLIRYAGYHNDTAMGMRVYVENRVSYKAYLDTFRKGIKDRQNGRACTCSSCNS